MQRGEIVMIMHMFKCGIFVLVLFVNGCTLRTNTIYGFGTGAFTDGAISGGAKLIGSYQSGKSETVITSPYRLLLWFQTTQDSVGNFLLHNVALVNDSTGEIAFQRSDSISASLTPERKGVSTAFFSFDGLMLKHATYHLEMLYDFEPQKTENAAKQRKVSVRLTKEFKKYKSSDFWDKIGSI
jgi:hypothetical protein